MKTKLEFALSTDADRHVDADCGCKMFFKDMGDYYDTRTEFCETHEKLAAPLRRLLADFELVLADVRQRERPAAT